MFKKIILLIALFLPVISLGEMNNIPVPQTYPVLYADFKQERIIHGFDMPLISTGKMIISEGKGLYWKQTSPFQMIMVLTPEKMTNQVEQGKPEIITTKDNPMLFQFSNLLSSLFTFDKKIILDYFTVESIKKIDANDVVTLKPKIAPINKIFSLIKLQINKNIEEVELTDLQGDITKVSFYNHQGLDKISPQDEKLFK